MLSLAENVSVGRGSDKQHSSRDNPGPLPRIIAPGNESPRSTVAALSKHLQGTSTSLPKKQREIDIIRARLAENIEAEDSYSRQKGRRELTAAEEQRSRDATSNFEHHAQEVDSQMREVERLHIHTQRFGDLPGETVLLANPPDMGGRYLANLDRIKRSNVSETAQTMPRDAHYHLQFDSEIPPVEWTSQEGLLHARMNGRIGKGMGSSATKNGKIHTLWRGYHHMEHAHHGNPNGLPHAPPPPAPQYHQEPPHHYTPVMENHHPYGGPPSAGMYPSQNYRPASTNVRVGDMKRKHMRATQACEQCRQRKQKCNEGQPCSFCKENNLTCQYRDTPPAKTDEHMEKSLSYMQNFTPSLSSLSSKDETAESVYDQLQTVREPLREAFSNRASGSLPYVPGRLNGKPVTPIGDIGASDNYISEDYAITNCYSINTDATGTTKLPNGTMAKVVGSLQLDYQFQNGGRTYEILFKVLRSSAHDVVLGKAFLKLTRTFKDFMKERILWKVPRFIRPLMYIGPTEQWMRGSLNGLPASTLADSWSNVMLISEEYAAAQGVIVYRRKEHCVRLQLGDKTIVRASGIVKNAEFAYEMDGPTYSCDLYVLKDMPCDVILSCDFLCETNAFEKYYDLIFDEELLDESDSYEATLNAIVNLDENIQRLKAKAKHLLGSSGNDTINARPQHTEITLAKSKQRLLQRISEVKKLQDQAQREIKLSEIRGELRHLEASVLQSTMNLSNAAAGAGASSTAQDPSQAQQRAQSTSTSTSGPSSSMTS